MLPAAERPSFWHDKILTDAAMKPIRDETGFRQLQDEFAQRP